MRKQDAEDDGMFAIVSSATTNPDRMRVKEMTASKPLRQCGRSIGEAIAMLRRGLSAPSQPAKRREYEMSRYSNDRDRDAQGRFMSDDEPRYSRGGSERDGAVVS
jgi:hypothetical protein